VTLAQSWKISISLVLVALSVQCFSDPGSRGGTGEVTSGSVDTADSATEVATTAGGTDLTTGMSSTAPTTTTTTSSETGMECSGSCKPVPPSGWFGPVAARESELGGALPSCQGGFPDEVWSLFGSIDVDGVCDCSCSLTEASCGSTNGYHYDAFSECSDLQDEFLIVDELCHEWNGPTSGGWRIDAAPAVGECEPVVTPMLSDPAFAHRWTACGGAMFGECPVRGDVCAPPLPTGYDHLCIFQEGDSPCPLGSSYNVREVRYTSLEDKRSCEGVECGCGEPTPDCATNLRLFSVSCTNAKGIVGQECDDVLQVTSYYMETALHPETNCPPDFKTLPPEGEVIGLGSVTFCCLP